VLVAITGRHQTRKSYNLACECVDDRLLWSCWELSIILSKKNWVRGRYPIIT